ncbi:phage tail protein [Ligilactobacillus pobuzihii]|uniref:phage tail protein n=1 Tax=Ligilactobacillus pobuzihii TaxID=449659 RepID=UPI0019D2BA02|nr:phage tail protein [Ligilactobacillus pobuzihii]MBN7275506.1 phage tail protein [Ligilactobacillus pobuzihii]
MAGIGLKMLYVGKKDTDGKVLTDEKEGLDSTGIFLLDTDKKNLNLGTKTANITGLSGTITKIDGNNETVDTSNPPASPSVAIDANLINYAKKNLMLGRVKNDIGGWFDGDVLPECGLIVESQSPITLKSVYYCFGRGNFTEAGQNVQTNTSTAETREDDNLTYSALTYPAFNKGKPFAVFYEDDPDFDKAKMMDLVFPGQTRYKTNDGGAKKA